MIVIPPDLLARFESILTRKSVPNQLRNYYKKWLLLQVGDVGENAT